MGWITAEKVPMADIWLKFVQPMATFMWASKLCVYTLNQKHLFHPLLETVQSFSGDALGILLLVPLSNSQMGFGDHNELAI